MNVKLLTEQNLEFLSQKGGCICWSESTYVKMPLCWKSSVTAHLFDSHAARVLKLSSCAVSLLMLSCHKIVQSMYTVNLEIFAEIVFSRIVLKRHIYLVKNSQLGHAYISKRQNDFAISREVLFFPETSHP